MKIFTKKTLVALLLIITANLTTFKANACTGGSWQGNITPTSSWQTLSGIAGGEYYNFTGVAGRVYIFSFCQGGGSYVDDPQIQILNSSGGVVANAYNDDHCGLGSELIWVCPSGGTFRVAFYEYNCQTDGQALGTVAYQYMPTPTRADCLGARPLCTTGNNVNNLESSGSGHYYDLHDYNATNGVPENYNYCPDCLTTGENFTNWYSFYAVSTGSLNFTIAPHVGSQDFDWAVWDLTGLDCRDLRSGSVWGTGTSTGNSHLNPISCNFCGTTGNTGAGGGGSTCNGPNSCSNWNSSLGVTAGRRYMMVIDNFSGTTNGYNINFSGVSVVDNVAPLLTSPTVYAPVCGSSSITVQFSEAVSCESMQNSCMTVSGPNGSFSIDDIWSQTCVSATGNTYSSGTFYDDIWTIDLADYMMDNGNYTVNLTTGCATDVCGNGMPSSTSSSVSFTINAITASINLLSHTCTGNTDGAISVTGASGGSPAYTYSWTGPSGYTSTASSISNLAAGTYYVTVSDQVGRCEWTESESVIAHPPPSNDNCANAIAIGSLPYSSGSVYNYCTSNDVPGSTTTCGAHYNNIWYRVTGTGDQLTASTCNAASFDTEIHVYTGSCGSMTEVFCNDDYSGCSGNSSNLSWCSTAGTTYYISVGSYGSTNFGTLTFTVTAAAYTTPTASNNGALCAGQALNLTGTGITGGTYSWSGPGGFTSTAQNPVRTPATSAMTGLYTVTVTNPATSCTATASTTATVNPNPNNDNCANAIAIGSLPYDSGVMNNNCATNDIPAGSGCGSYGSNVWFRVTGTGNQMVVSTDNAGFQLDTEVHIYTGSCGSMTEVACNDDGSGVSHSLASLIEWCSTLGTTYYISVGYYSTSSVFGNYQLTVVDRPLGAPTAVSSSPATICVGNSSSLSGTIGTYGNGITWYTGGCGTTSVGTTIPLSVSPDLTTTYYARTKGTCGNYSTSCTSVVVNVNSESWNPTSAAADPSTICVGSSTDLTVTPATDPNILDYSTWSTGTGSATGFNQNGATAENYRINSTDPWGNTTVIWEARPDAVSGADGGWNTSNFAVDNTKIYRYAVWVWRNGNGNGSFYLGCHGYGAVNGVITLSSGANNTNPYFMASSSVPTAGRWELVVGHVYPHTYGGTANHPESGRYTIANGRVANTSNDYKWRPETTSGNYRTYLYYCTNTSVRQRWAYPRVDICDGTEPTINELLNGFDPNETLGTGADWEWYSGSCGGTAVGTGTTITESPGSSTTYYVRAEGTCNSTSCVSTPVTVNTFSTAPTSVSGTTTICNGNSTTLTAVGGVAGTNSNLNWFEGSCGGAFMEEWFTQPYGGVGSTVLNSVDGILDVTSTGTDPMFSMSGLGSFNPAVYKYINVRYRVVSGTAGNTEIFFYNTAHGGAVGGESASGALISDGSWHILNIDMTSDPQYTTGGNITGWRYDWCTASGVRMEIDYIALSSSMAIGQGSSIVVSPTSNTSYHVLRSGPCNTTTCASTSITVDTSNPTYGGYSNISGYQYQESPTVYWVKSGNDFKIDITHSDNISARTQYFGFNKDDCNPNGCGGAPFEIKSYNTNNTFTDWLSNNTYIDINSATCVDGDGSCTDVDVTRRWNSNIKATCEDWDYKLHTYLYDHCNFGVGYTDMGLWVKVDNTAPTHDEVTVSDNCWIANGTNTYTITIKSTEPRSGFGGSYGMMALVNYNLGEPNAGGYFAWHPTNYVHSDNNMACTGGGYVSKAGSWGGSRIDLISATTSVVGDQRTVTFTVRPHSNFIELNGTNKISMYTSDNCNNYRGWTLFNPNFTSMRVPNTPTSATTICNGASANLSTTSSPASGITYYWQTSSTGTSTTIGSGSSVSVSPTTTTTYYVRPYSSAGCWGQASLGVTVTVNALSTPPTSISGTTTICNGGSTTLTAVGGTDGTGASYQWYAGGCGSGSVLGTGVSIVVSPTSNTNYYVRRTGTCNTTTCASTAVTVQSLSTAPSSITGTSVICMGANTTLTVSGGSLGAGATWNWYSASCGGTSEGTGSSIIVSPTSTTTYYVRAEGTCNNTTCASLIVHMNNDGQPVGTWTGTISTDWTDCRNWGQGQVPTNTIDVIIPAGCSNWPELAYVTDGSYACRNITIQSNAALNSTLDNDVVRFAGSVNIQSNGILNQSNGRVFVHGTSVDIDGTWNGTGGYNVFYGTSWDDSNGLYNQDPGLTTYFYRTSGTVTINANSSSTFGALLLGDNNTTATTYTLSSAINVDGYINIRNSGKTLNSNNQSITLSGDWTNAGTFTFGTSTVTFDGTSNQNINSGGTAEAKKFYNVSINNSSTVTMTASTVVNHNFNVNNGTFLINNLSLYTINAVAGSASIASGAEVDLTGSSSYWRTASSNNGNLTINGTLDLNAGKVTTGAGITLNASGVINQDGGSIGVGDNFTISGTYNGNAGTLRGRSDSDNWAPNIIVNSTNVYVYDFFDTGGTDVNPTIINGSQPLIVNNNVTINSGYLNANGKIIQVKGNWTDVNGYHTHNNGTVVFNGTSQQTINSAASFGNITFNNSNGAILSDDLNVDNVGTFTDGVVDPNGNNVLFTSTASTVGGNNNSFVNGTVTKSGSANFKFPTGMIVNREIGAGVNQYSVYGGIEFAPVAGTPNTDVTYHFDQPPYDWWEHGGNMDATLHHVSDREYWNIVSTSDIGNVKTYWTDNSHANGTPCLHGMCPNNIPSGFSMNDISLSCWHNTMWKDLGVDATTGAHDGGTMSARDPLPTGSKGNQIVTYGSRTGSTPLPVELIDFRASCIDNYISLLWETSAEINNDYFEIQKSKDCKMWNPIGKVIGAGNSNSTNYYSFDDLDIDNNVVYYRLKQVDFDGTFKYSDFIKIECKNLTAPEIIFYPNPFNDNLNISIDNWPEEFIRIEMYDMMGRKIDEFIFEDVKYSYHTYIDLGHLPPAVYLFRIVNKENIINRKVEKH